MNWLLKTIGELSEVVTKGTTPTSIGHRFIEKGVNYVKVESISTNGFFIENKLAKISDECHADLGRSQLKSGDILFSIAGALGRTAVVTDKILPANTNQALAIIRLKSTDEISLKFLERALSTGFVLEQVEKHRGGAAQQNLSLTQIKSFNVPVPPLPEQERIVGVLDEAFEGIATATAQAEKNLQNARELFQSVLQSTFSQKGDDWVKLSLFELLEKGWITSHLDGNHGSDYPRKAEFISEGIPYISAKCIKNESVDLSLAKYLSSERAAGLRKGIAQNNDVLFAHNATVGPVAILKTQAKKVILGTSLTYYRCDQNHILPEYLAHYMRSHRFKSQYLEIMQQSTRNQVPITKQREFNHIVPPLKEQHPIVEKLDTLSEKTKQLEAIYQRKLDALAELKQSLLQRAFTGQL